MIDADDPASSDLFDETLRQFGYSLEHSSKAEQLAMLRVFAMHQATADLAPILVIENADAITPNMMESLCALAALKLRNGSALRIILTSDQPLEPIINSPVAECLGRRLTHNIHLRPMTLSDARQYISAKLTAAGLDAAPEAVFPRAVCFELWCASGGWPGILDRLALLALANAKSIPVSVDAIERPALPEGTWRTAELPKTLPDAAAAPAPPRLYVTLNGKTQQDLVVDQPRLLVGRTEHNDIAIASKFISRHHLMLVRQGKVTILMDLNSRNGTYVNSQRVSNHVLLDNDVITLGHYRIKFSDPSATKAVALDAVEFADTSIMKTLDDMRNLLARDDAEPLEKFPTSQPTTA